MRRTCVLTPQERADFNPLSFVQKMKDAGFLFDSDVCPVKMKQPWAMQAQPNGDIVYSQWDWADEQPEPRGVQ